MEDLISIIIPVYNRMDYLGECLNSVLNQTYQNLEIILIDDGSSDGTLELCKQYGEKDSRIVLIAANHGGVSKARNLGLDAAKGSFILFVDSDDVLHPSLAETLLRGLVDTGAAMAGTKSLPILLDSWHKVPQLIQESTDAETVYKTHEEFIHDFFMGFLPLGLLAES